MPASVQGRTFYVFPLESQQASAEFVRYSDSISSKLAATGLRRVQALRDADYVVTFNYGVSGSRTQTGSTPIFGQTGGGTTTHSGTVNSFGPGGFATGNFFGSSYTPPTYGVVGAVPYTVTNHNRFLRLRIIDVKASTNDRLVPVYEGEVLSEGSAASFAQVSTCMFNALFSNFRRNGSETIRVNADTCAGK